MKKQLDTVSFFSGIGAFEKAAERLGINLNIKAYCEIDKWASTSYSAIHGTNEDMNMWDILEIDPNNVPDCDLITHGSPCFKEGTLITTSQGLKVIEDIEKGDLVLTHKNRFKEVVKPMINYANHIYKLTMPSGEVTYVTEEHPYYAKRKVDSEAEWITVKDLTSSDYIGQVEVVSNKVIWVPYKEKKFVEYYNDFVYNFEVEDDNSYVANSSIVHNCQDFSVAGQNKGGDAGSETRSSLMWTTVNIIEQKMPKFVIWENVKGVLSKDHKHNFDNYLLALESLGYNNYHNLLNAKNYGIPQNRDRVYIVSIRKDIDNDKFKFPEPFVNNLRLKHLLEDSVQEKYFINKASYEKILEEIKEKRLDFSMNDYQVRACLTPDRIHRRQEGRRFKEDGEPMFTITANDRHGVITCKQVMTIPKHIINDNERQRRVYSPEGISPAVLSRIDSAKILQLGKLDMKGSEQVRRVYDPEGFAPTLDTMQGGHRQPKIICEEINYASLYFVENSITVHDSIKPSVAINFEREKHEIFNSTKAIYQCQCKSGWQDNKVGLTLSPTLRAGNSHTSVLDNRFRIRKLTPLECWRLMGFDDSDYWSARKALEAKYYNGKDRSNSQMYKQAGNSIVVDVLEAIYKELFVEYM